MSVFRCFFILLLAIGVAAPLLAQSQVSGDADLREPPPWLEHLASRAFVLEWVTVIALYFVGALVWYAKSWFPVHSAIKSAQEKLTELAVKPGGSEISETVFASNYQVYSDFVAAQPKLADVWEEFGHCLDRSGDPDDAGQHQGVIRNWREPDEYLNEASIINPNIRTSFFQNVPSQFAALGILGTFIGLSAGIALASPQLTQGNSEAAISAIGDLLDGASVAFITSVAGIFGSLTFVLIERYSMSALHRKLGKWVHDLGGAIRLVTAEDLAERQLELQKRTVGALETFVDDLAIRLLGTFEEALDKNFSDKLGPKLVELVEAVRVAGTNQSEHNQEGLSDMAKAFQEQLDQNIGSQFSAIAETLQNLNAALNSSTQSMEQLQRDLQQGLREMMETTKTSVNEGSAEMRSAVSEQMTEITGTIRSAIETLSEQTDQSSNKFSEQLSESSSAAAAALQDSAAGVAQTLQKSASQVSEVLTTGSDTASWTLTTAVDKVARELGKSMEVLSQRIETTSSTLMDRMAESSKTAAADLSGSLSGFREGVTALQTNTEGNADLLQAVTVLLERLEGVGTSLDIVHTQIRETTTPLVEATATLQTTADHLHEQLNMAVTTVETIRNSATAIEGSLETTTSVWKNYEERFLAIDDDLGNTFDKMQGGTAEFMEKNHEFLSTLDALAGEAIAKLASANAQLREAVDELADVMSTTN